MWSSGSEEPAALGGAADEDAEEAARRAKPVDGDDEMAFARCVQSHSRDEYAPALSSSLLGGGKLTRAPQCSPHSLLRIRQEVDKLLAFQASKQADPAKRRAFMVAHCQELLHDLSVSPSLALVGQSAISLRSRSSPLTDCKATHAGRTLFSSADAGRGGALSRAGAESWTIDRSSVVLEAFLWQNPIGPRVQRVQRGASPRAVGGLGLFFPRRWLWLCCCPASPPCRTDLVSGA